MYTVFPMLKLKPLGVYKFLYPLKNLLLIMHALSIPNTCQYRC